MEDFQALWSAVGGKAEAAQVPTSKAFEALRNAVAVLEKEARAPARKATGGQGPTIAEFEALRAAVEPKAKAEQRLAHAAQREAELRGKLDSLHAAMAQKANAHQVPTYAEFGALHAAVAQKANVDQVATAGQVPTRVEFEALRAAVAQKANADQVPTYAEFHALGTSLGGQGLRAQLAAEPRLQASLHRRGAHADEAGGVRDTVGGWPEASAPRGRAGAEVARALSQPALLLAADMARSVSQPALKSRPGAEGPRQRLEGAAKDRLPPLSDHRSQRDAMHTMLMDHVAIGQWRR